MHHDLAVLTPEKVVVNYRLSGIGSRVGAHVVDGIILGLLIVGATLVSIRLFSFDEGVVTFVVLMLLTFAPFIYFGAFEALWNGQTPGKKALSIRVRMADGLPVTPSAAVFRNLLRPADFIPVFYLAGLLAIFTNPRSQRIGDLAAGTIVTHEPRAIPVFDASPHHVGKHPFEDAVGELRGMNPEEYAAIKRLCDRFPELPPSIQERNLREIWYPFAHRRQVPQVPGVHAVFLMEAVVMRYGRERGLL